jgi:hypothetical protein
VGWIPAIGVACGGEVDNMLELLGGVVKRRVVPTDHLLEKENEI